MAQFRSTADILDLALLAAGEVTNGNSPYEAQALNYINRVHFAIVAGGTIPLGKDATVDIDEPWTWAQAERPLILELQPKYNTGSVTLTQGSEAGTFSSAPTDSLAGWNLRITGRDEVLRIASHTAGGTAFELDGAYPDASGSGLNFESFLLDYDLVPSYLVIDSTNNKIQFQKAAASPLTGTLTSGTYTPAQLVAHIASVITAAAGGPTVTGSYSSTTKLFTLTSDLAGATLFQIIGNGSQSKYSVHRLLGFDDVTTASAAAQTSTYVLGGIARLVEPMKINKGAGGTGSLLGVDSETFQRNYPLRVITEAYPDRYTVLRETNEGILTLRLNAYPTDKTRIEIEYIPVPRDLKDDATSVPLIPRKHSDVLEDATAFYICFLKNDDKAQSFAALVQGKLSAMTAQKDGGLQRTGENFGQLIPRRDRTKGFRRFFDREPY